MPMPMPNISMSARFLPQGSLQMPTESLLRASKFPPTMATRNQVLLCPARVPPCQRAQTRPPMSPASTVCQQSSSLNLPVLPLGVRLLLLHPRPRRGLKADLNQLLLRIPLHQEQSAVLSRGGVRGTDPQLKCVLFPSRVLLKPFECV